MFYSLFINSNPISRRRQTSHRGGTVWDVLPAGIEQVESCHSWSWFQHCMRVVLECPGMLVVVGGWSRGSVKVRNSAYVRWRGEQHIPPRDRRTRGFQSLKIRGCQAMSHSWGWILLPLRECILFAAFWCQLAVSWLECSLLSREKTCVLSQRKTHRKFRQDVPYECEPSSRW